MKIKENHSKGSGDIIWSVLENVRDRITDRLTDEGHSYNHHLLPGGG